jgi:hypothetical protein
VGELELEGKGKPGNTTVAELELISVFIHFVDGEDFGDNVKITSGFISMGEGLVKIFGDTVVRAEVLANPFAEGAKLGCLVLFESSPLSVPGDWGEGCILSVEEGP